MNLIDGRCRGRKALGAGSLGKRDGLQGKYEGFDLGAAGVLTVAAGGQEGETGASWLAESRTGRCASKS